MKIPVATLCDSASIYQNRLCILGTFDTLTGDKLPIVKSQCAIAFQMNWAKSEEGTHIIRVQYMNEDGQRTLDDMVSNVEVSVPENTYFAATNHIIHLQQLTFNKTGTYQITIFIDEQISAEIQLQVLVTEQK